jgi:hypothetical protein
MSQQRCESSGCIDVNAYGEHGQYIRVRSSVTGTVMQCTPEEWYAFLDDLGAGRWAHIGADQAVPS